MGEIAFERAMRRKFIREYGGRVEKLVLVAGAGFPDRTFLLKGHQPAFIEFKNPNGRGVVDPLQAEWIRWLNENGFVAGVAASEEEVISILARARR